MIILGIDWGKAKIGLAIAEGPLADPLGVIRVGSMADAVEKTMQAIRTHSVDKVIVGVSENQIAVEQRKFIQLLRENGVEVEEWDETLSTHDAEVFSIQSGAGPKKRREMEDALAAAIVVQSYIDSHGN